MEELAAVAAAETTAAAAAWTEPIATNSMSVESGDTSAADRSFCDGPSRKKRPPPAAGCRSQPREGKVARARAGRSDWRELIRIFSSLQGRGVLSSRRFLLVPQLAAQSAQSHLLEKQGIIPWDGTPHK